MSRRVSDHKKQYIFQYFVSPNGSAQIIKHPLGRQLGKGGFAICYEMIDVITKRSCAVKAILKKPQPNGGYQNYEKIMSEIKILSMFDHPNFVKYYRHFDDSQKVYIVLELCAHGSFSSILKQRKYLSEPQVRYFVVQMVEILTKLKYSKVIHRDIKLANYLIDQNFRLKLADFGLSMIVSNDVRKPTICGTPNYIAPEMIDKRPYSYQVDLWSTGVLIFTLLLGIPPFQTKSCKQTYDRIRKCNFKFQGPHHVKLSQEAKSFISSILILEPAKRIKLENIMAHPFIQNFTIPKKLQSNWIFSSPSRSFIKLYSSNVVPKISESDYIKQEDSLVKKQAVQIIKIDITEQNPRDISKSYSQIPQDQPKQEKIKKQQINKQDIIQKKTSQKVAAVELSSSTQKKKIRLKSQSLKKQQEIPSINKNPSKNGTYTLLEQLQPVLQTKLKKSPHKIHIVTPEQRKKINPPEQFKIIHVQPHQKRFGIVFVLSNHQICFLFNDHTKYILASSHKSATYIYRVKEKTIQMPINLDQFQKIAQISKVKKSIITNCYSKLSKKFHPMSQLQIDSKSSLNYIKSYKMKNQFLICWLNNGDMQAFFSDGTKVKVSMLKKILVYKKENDVASFIYLPIHEEIDQNVKKTLNKISDFLKISLEKQSNSQQKHLNKKDLYLSTKSLKRKF